MTGKVLPDLWALALDYLRCQKKREASGWRLGEPGLPPITIPIHTRQLADMDLAIVCAKAVFAAGYKKELEGEGGMMETKVIDEKSSPKPTKWPTNY